MTKIEMDGLFRLENKERLPYEEKDNTWVSITIEMSQDILQYER